MKAVFGVVALLARIEDFIHHKLPQPLAFIVLMMINFPLMLVAVLIGLLWGKKMEKSIGTQESLRKVIKEFPRHTVDHQELSYFQKYVDDFIIALQNYSDAKLEVSIELSKSMSALNKKNSLKSDNPEFFNLANFYSFQDGSIIEDHMFGWGNPLFSWRSKKYCLLFMKIIALWSIS